MSSNIKRTDATLSQSAENFKESSLPRCYRLLCLHRELQRARLPSTLAQLSVLTTSKSHIHLRNTPCARFNLWTDQGVPSRVFYPGLQGLHNRQHVRSNSHQNVALSIMVKVCHQDKKGGFLLYDAQRLHQPNAPCPELQKLPLPSCLCPQVHSYQAVSIWHGQKAPRDAQKGFSCGQSMS